MCIAGALLCIAAAFGITRVFSGNWNSINKGRTVSIAGPALTYHPELDAKFAEIAPAKSYAYITGAVENPGVYEIGPNARLFNLVELAGGLRHDADSSKINLAKQVADGDHFHIETVKQNASSSSASTSVAVPAKSGTSSKKGSETVIVNVNTAGEEELQALPGVGPVLAKSIVEHRKSHGSFKSAEDLLDVSGIGKKKLEGMRSRLQF